MTSRLHLRIVLLLLLLLAGARPGSAQVLRYDGDPGTSRTYVREQHDHVLQTFDGRQSATDIESYWRLETRVAAATPETLTIEVVHDSLAITATPSPEALDLSGVEGVGIEIVMTRRGSVREVQVPAGLPPDAARLDLETTYRSFFPRLPDGEAVEGTAWSDSTLVRVHQNGLDLQVLRVDHYLSKGWATLEQGRAVRVDTEAVLSIEGSGEQQEAGIVLRGSGRGTGGFAFDPETGAYLGGGETLEMRMVALVTTQGQGIVIPIVQNRTETITLVSQRAERGE